MILQPRLSRTPLAGHQQRSIRSGDLEVRLAATAAEIDAAQALRYRVFYEEMGARATPEVAASRRDRDRFDAYCDHLLVIDHARSAGPDSVVGTYRLLRGSVARRHGGFYTATEFDITPLLAVPGEPLELGRSCVEAAYRTRPTMQLLWRGIAEYCFGHGISLMFGCASLPGTNIATLAPALAYLHYNHLAPPALRARALPERFVRMDLLPPDDIDTAAVVAQLDKRATVSALPPLIKGYLRIGALIGEGAVIDHDFNTTDVCIIVVMDRIVGKYFNHYMRET
ncbi:MAG TPA: GNAT family N-acyltransferase [Stellaceae bacterium]|nr:GNAT family N-acyltransferase [Stellaceae bacterium]